MKSERRHELKTNTLAHNLGNLPELWRQYGTKILLGVVAVLAIILWIRVQRNNAIQQREMAGEALSSAVSGIQSIQNLPLTVRDPRLTNEHAKQIQSQVETAISQVLDTSDDEAVKAEALVARGDLNWHLATLPGMRVTSALSGTRPTTSKAATRTASNSSEVEELLNKAQRAYDAAAHTAGAKPLTVATAKFGIAAIAEERQQWDAARKAYEEVRDDKSISQPFQEHAKLKLDDLTTIQKPVLIGKPATEPALPDIEAQGPPAPTSTGTRPTTKPTTSATSTAPAAKR